MTESADVPLEIVTNLRSVCLGLPEAGVAWDEVAELLTESYCVLAPKKLVEMIDRPTSV